MLGEAVERIEGIEGIDYQRFIFGRVVPIVQSCLRVHGRKIGENGANGMSHAIRALLSQNQLIR